MFDKARAFDFFLRRLVSFFKTQKIERLLQSTTTGLLLVSTTLSLIEIRKMGGLPQRHIETAARELQDANRQLNRNRKGPRALRRSAFLVSHWHKRPPGPRKTRAESEKEGASSCGPRPARASMLALVKRAKGHPGPPWEVPGLKKEKHARAARHKKKKTNHFFLIIMKEEALRALQRPLSSHF